MPFFPLSYFLYKDIASNHELADNSLVSLSSSLNAGDFASFGSMGISKSEAGNRSRGSPNSSLNSEIPRDL